MTTERERPMTARELEAFMRRDPEARIPTEADLPTDEADRFVVGVDLGKSSSHYAVATKTTVLDAAVWIARATELGHAYREAIKARKRALKARADADLTTTLLWERERLQKEHRDAVMLEGEAREVLLDFLDPQSIPF